MLQSATLPRRLSILRSLSVSGLRFRRMDAEDRQFLPRQSSVPRLIMRQVVDAIDAAKGQEMDDEHLPTEFFERERLGV